MSTIKHVTDFSKGYFRKGSSKNFSYTNEHGKIIQGSKIIAQIKSLVIPPAWDDVWITRDQDAHILAVGFDDKGRKQYIYNPKWAKKKQKQKYDRTIDLGVKLPEIRKQVKKDLAGEELTKRWVVALIVRVLDKTGIRIGNEKYTEQNQTYGLTTLRKKHMEIVEGQKKSQEVVFHFVGKSHKEQEYHIEDQSIIDDINALDDLPGYEIFQYRDDKGKKQGVTPQDVNLYIDQIAGEIFSAKDFRTWRGTTCAVEVLLQHIKKDNFPLEEKQQLEIIKHVANELGNTPVVTREHYIHPKIQKLFGSKKAPKYTKNQITGLNKTEQATLAFLG